MGIIIKILPNYLKYQKMILKKGSDLPTLEEIKEQNNEKMSN